MTHLAHPLPDSFPDGIWFSSRTCGVWREPIAWQGWAVTLALLASAIASIALLFVNLQDGIIAAVISVALALAFLGTYVKICDAHRSFAIGQPT